MPTVKWITFSERPKWTDDDEYMALVLRVPRIEKRILRLKPKISRLFRCVCTVLYKQPTAKPIINIRFHDVVHGCEFLVSICSPNKINNSILFGYCWAVCERKSVGPLWIKYIIIMKINTHKKKKEMNGTKGAKIVWKRIKKQNLLNNFS